jgi:hypothetical protein
MKLGGRLSDAIQNLYTKRLFTYFVCVGAV